MCRVLDLKLKKLRTEEMTVFCSLTVLTAGTALVVLSSLIITMRSLAKSIFRMSFLVVSDMI